MYLKAREAVRILLGHSIQEGGSQGGVILGQDAKRLGIARLLLQHPLQGGEAEERVSPRKRRDAQPEANFGIARMQFVGLLQLSERLVEAVRPVQSHSEEKMGRPLIRLKLK